jgi:hypothetical protein
MREDGITIRTVVPVHRDAGNELHAEVARQILGLGLVDLLDPDHVGIELAEDVGDAWQADPAIQSPASMNVVGRDAN